MDLQSKIQELAARFASDLVSALRGATLEDIHSIAAGEVPAAATAEAEPKRPARRKRSWRRMKRYRPYR